MLREGRLNSLPRVTITSYEMTRRLTCDTCIAGAARTAYEALRGQVQRGEVKGERGKRCLRSQMGHEACPGGAGSVSRQFRV